MSGSAGNFTLTDQASGKTYQLAGDTSKLSEHVGHQVKITGSSSEASAAGTTPSGTTGATGAAGTTGAAGATGAGAQSTFEVKSVKMISETCPSTSK